MRLTSKQCQGDYGLVSIPLVQGDVTRINQASGKPIEEKAENV